VKTPRLDAALPWKSIRVASCTMSSPSRCVLRLAVAVLPFGPVTVRDTPTRSSSAFASIVVVAPAVRPAGPVMERLPV
jgi:hypothetical protein